MGTDQTKKPKTAADRRIDELLDREIRGCHGMSERRAVAQFVKDAIEDGGISALQAAESLAGFAAELVKMVKKAGGR